MKNLHEFGRSVPAKPPSLADLPYQVGSRVRRQRLAFQWRQSDLAERAGLSTQTVKSIEKGEAISYENLMRLLLALGHGNDLLQMLERPHFPNLGAHERFVSLAKDDAMSSRRVRTAERA